LVVATVAEAASAAALVAVTPAAVAPQVAGKDIFL
jgi:hypothetical protein